MERRRSCGMWPRISFIRWWRVRGFTGRWRYLPCGDAEVSAKGRRREDARSPEGRRDIREKPHFSHGMREMGRSDLNVFPAVSLQTLRHSGIFAEITGTAGLFNVLWLHRPLDAVHHPP